MPPSTEIGQADPDDRIAGAQAAAATQRPLEHDAVMPERTALLVMHYQTDILGLFPSVAPALLANTRSLCNAARQTGVSVYFANIQFSPGYPEVSPLNKNGQGIKQLGLFMGDELSPELGRLPSEPLIIAHRASVFFGTDLQVRLSARGIDTLMMVGIASTGVVLSSVAHASDADFRLLTVKDCCYDPDPVVHDHLFATAFASRTTVLSLAEALSWLSQPSARPGHHSAAT
mgnify:CR=1 FL=1